MEDGYIELIDYTLQPALVGVLTIVASLLAGYFGILPTVAVTVLVTVGAIVATAAMVVFGLDPLLFRTETTLRIEWQWFSEKSLSHVAKDLRKLSRAGD